MMVTPMALEAARLAAIREQFPILSRTFDGKPLVYLDNAATAQKPTAVLERLQRFYADENANIHRGVHRLSQTATEAYEAARARVARFINAADHREVVFTRGATESINLVASGLAQSRLKAGDVVLVSGMEHHANIVPWQLLRERIGIRLEVVDVDEDGLLDVVDFHDKLKRLRHALLSIVHVSNSIGCINPVRAMIAAAHDAGTPVLVDACQSVPHFGVDVRDLDCDWLVFSGHKVFGPTGIGVLYGKLERLEALPPYQGGGDMIETVAWERTRFKGSPERFEAGTPHIAGAIGLAAAMDFLDGLDRPALVAHENWLRKRAEAGLRAIPGLRLLGGTTDKASVVSFVLESAHPHDIASFLDADGIAIRSGHHCCQPLMTRLGLSGTARASFAFYNTEAEVDALIRGVERIQQFFG